MENPTEAIANGITVERMAKCIIEGKPIEDDQKLLNAKIFKMHFRNTAEADNKVYSLLDFCSLEGLENS